MAIRSRHRAARALPYDESRYDTGSDKWQFTSYERDAESGLDYFGARYFGSNMGRFMSPDSTGYSSLANPQAWNRLCLRWWDFVYFNVVPQAEGVSSETARPRRHVIDAQPNRALWMFFAFLALVHSNSRFWQSSILILIVGSVEETVAAFSGPTPVDRQAGSEERDTA